MIQQPRSIQQRLIKRLRADPEFRRLWALRSARSEYMDAEPLPEGSRLERVHGSQAMRSAGAWSWSAIGPAGELYPVGSHYPMTMLIHAKVIRIRLYSLARDGTDDIEIDPGVIDDVNSPRSEG